MILVKLLQKANIMKIKYLHTLFLSLILSVSFAQQVPREFVVLEMFTGTW